MASSELNIRQLILVPALITLGVTLLRLVGELNNWSPVLFSREAGGGGAIVGISWLPIIFGVYFALKLVKMGHGPKSGWKAAGFSLLAILAIVAVFAGASAVSSSFFVPMAAGAVGSLLALFVLSKGWAELFKTLVGLCVRGAHPGADRHAHCHVRRVGHALRGRATEYAGDGTLRQMDRDRCDSTNDILDRVHRSSRKSLWQYCGRSNGEGSEAGRPDGLVLRAEELLGLSPRDGEGFPLLRCEVLREKDDLAHVRRIVR